MAADAASGRCALPYAAGVWRLAQPAGLAPPRLGGARGGGRTGWRQGLLRRGLVCRRGDHRGGSPGRVAIARAGSVSGGSVAGARTRTVRRAVWPRRSHRAWAPAHAAAHVWCTPRLAGAGSPRPLPGGGTLPALPGATPRSGSPSSHSASSPSAAASRWGPPSSRPGRHHPATQRAAAPAGHAAAEGVASITVSMRYRHLLAALQWSWEASPGSPAAQRRAAAPPVCPGARRQTAQHGPPGAGRAPQDGIG